MKKIIFIFWLCLLIISGQAKAEYTGIGVGADVPDNGNNNVYLQVTTDQPEPAENLWLQDFWAQLLTEENAKRPINHTKADILASWIGLILFDIAIICLIFLILWLLYRLFYKKKKKQKKQRKKSA